MKYNLKLDKQILGSDERYCIPGLNEIRVIKDRQTLSLALGTCISTVIIGRNDGYHLGANHIVIAKPARVSSLATKSAGEQVEEIVCIFREILGIDQFYCLHLVGAGMKLMKSRFNVHETNIINTLEVLDNRKMGVLFRDTGSHFFASYSINDRFLSVMVENKNISYHKSLVIDLDLLFNMNVRDGKIFPASMLEPNNFGFEFLASENVIPIITGIRNAPGV